MSLDFYSRMNDEIYRQNRNKIHGCWRWNVPSLASNSSNQFCETHVWTNSFIWLVVYLPLWKIWLRQLGWLFTIYGKIKFHSSSHHQPVIYSWWYFHVSPFDSLSKPFENDGGRHPSSSYVIIFLQWTITVVYMVPPPSPNPIGSKVFITQTSFQWSFNRINTRCSGLIFSSSKLRYGCVWNPMDCHHWYHIPDFFTETHMEDLPWT